jgi:hypothetical protein
MLSGQGDLYATRVRRLYVRVPTSIPHDSPPTSYLAYFGSSATTGIAAQTRVAASALLAAAAAIVHKAPLKIYARGVVLVSYFYFSRAPRVRALKIRQINSAILKVPDGAWIR